MCKPFWCSGLNIMGEKVITIVADASSIAMSSAIMI